MKNNQVYGTYLGHSSFVLFYPQATMVFDWYKGKLPSLPKDLPLYIFISHIHEDHFNPEIFKTAQKHGNAEIFLGYDGKDAALNTLIAGLKPQIREKLHVMDGNQSLYSADREMLVETMPSTDLGVAFLIRHAGKTIFHSGDLALWGSTMNPGFGRAFEGDVMPLTGQPIDYGILCMDSRYPENAERTIRSYMNTARFRLWSPMHFWDNYGFVDTYLADHPDYASAMIAVTKNPSVHLGITLNQKFPLFETDEQETEELKKTMAYRYETGQREIRRQAAAGTQLQKEKDIRAAGIQACADYILSGKDPRMVRASQAKDKVEEAIRAYGRNVRFEDVLAIDNMTSFFSRTPQGILYTKTGIVSNMSDGVKIEYDKVESVARDKNGISLSMTMGKCLSCDFKKANDSVYSLLKAMLDKKKSVRLNG